MQRTRVLSKQLASSENQIKFDASDPTVILFSERAMGIQVAKKKKTDFLRFVYRVYLYVLCYSKEKLQKLSFLNYTLTDRDTGNRVGQLAIFVNINTKGNTTFL